MSGRLVYYIIFNLLFVSVSFGQTTYFLKFNPEIESSGNQNIQVDSLQITTETTRYLSLLHGKGYLTAGLDSVIFLRDTVSAYYTPGEKYYWISLKPKGFDPGDLRKAGFRDKFFRNQPFRYSQLISLEQSIVDDAQNKGAPFAKVWLDSIVVNDQKINAQILFDPGPLVTFDSIEITGSDKFRSAFLQRYLKIRKDDYYSQKDVNQIPVLISRLNYIELARMPSVIFRDNRARVIIGVKEKKANYIDGIVGFLPNSQKNGKLLLTGEANLALNNLFRRGIGFKGAWKKFNVSGQVLELDYFHPLLIKTPFDLTADFNLLKQDTLYINIDRGIKIGQALSGYNRINIVTSFKSSRKLGTAPVTAQEVNDFNFQQYGIEFSSDRLDNIFLPRRGFYLKSSFTAGNKSLKNVSDENAEKFAGATRSLQIQSKVLIQKFFRVKSSVTFLCQVNAGTVYNNKNLIFVSDLYQVGGFNSLRGFSEREFFARDYAIGTGEFRFFMDQTSYLTLIIDQGYIFNPLNKNITINYPTGFGAGFSFSAGPGMFSFIYSLGRSKTQDLKFNLSKIHFGFTSKF
jgi:translocation and assembly module TamA